MSTKAIEPISSTKTAPAAAVTAPAKREAPHGARPARPAAPPPAPAATPAATVSTTSVPASVSPADRSLYLQILKSLGGNVTAALAALDALAAKKASEPGS